MIDLKRQLPRELGIVDELSDEEVKELSEYDRALDTWKAEDIDDLWEQVAAHQKVIETQLTHESLFAPKDSIELCSELILINEGLIQRIVDDQQYHVARMRKKLNALKSIIRKKADSLTLKEDGVEWCKDLYSYKRLMKQIREDEDIIMGWRCKENE